MSILYGRISQGHPHLPKMIAKRFIYVAFTVILASKINLAPANAQIGDWFPDEVIGYDILKVPDKKQKTYIDVGAGVITRNRFHGSSQKNTRFYPLINAEYKGRWFANPFNGIGFYPVNTQKINIATSLTYNSGRKTNSTQYNSPLFDLDRGITVKTAARYRFKYGAITASTKLPITGDVRGVSSSLSATTRLPITKQISLVPSVSIGIDSGKRLTTFYGINTAQSAITGTPVLDFDNGVSGYGLSLAGYWRSKDKNIQLLGGMSYRILDNSLKASPLVTQSDSILLGVGLAKRY